MKVYLAPLEGITNVFYRSHFDAHFHGVDKYFIPFINPTDCMLSHKQERELNPERNQLHATVVPQIISSNAKETLWLISYLKDCGYKEVNLNFGCPSGTVLSKGRGAGMLRDLVQMDAYLQEVYASSPLPVSVKIRLGIKDVSEFEKIIPILNKYPLHELILHPRTAKEKYEGPLHLDVFEKALSEIKCPVIYNGEIHTLHDIHSVEEHFPTLSGVMIGRSLIARPDMLEEPREEKERVANIRSFYEELKKEYCDNFGWNNTKFFVKEVWSLMIGSFDVPKKMKKDLFKAEKEDDFEKAVNAVFENCSLVKDAGDGIVF